MAKLPPKLSPDEIKRVVATAWDDPAPYVHTQMEHAISKGELVALMKRELSPTAYKQWAAKAKTAKAPTVKARFPFGR
ncbi:MAG: DUF2805 domain-containing protein [Paucibacter sp.]|nr:DUF2805 domain-containing protein [Roseateles sp.]